MNEISRILSAIEPDDPHAIQRLFAHDAPNDDLIDLDEALEPLEADDPVSANLVKLRYSAGLGQADAAEVMALPRRTAD